MAALVQQIWRGALALISAPRCPVCAAALLDPPRVEPMALEAALFCGECVQQLALPQGGLQGDVPLLWCAAAPYDGALRRLLLRQRPRPEPPVIAALAAVLHRSCSTVLPGALLVPIPSWKRRGNPLPQLVAQELARRAGASTAVLPQLLQRHRPTLGQHHLSRSLRQRNLQGAFACGPAQGSRPLWLVDDILTTGFTAAAAAAALQAGGHAVQGVLTLARTPARRRL